MVRTAGLFAFSALQLNYNYISSRVPQKEGFCSRPPPWPAAGINLPRGGGCTSGWEGEACGSGAVREASETGRVQRRAGSTFATAWTQDGAKSLCPTATARPLTSAVREPCVRSRLCFSFICLRGEREQKEPLKTDRICAKEANGGHPESTRASRGSERFHAGNA